MAFEPKMTFDGVAIVALGASGLIAYIRNQTNVKDRLDSHTMLVEKLADISAQNTETLRIVVQNAAVMNAVCNERHGKSIPQLKVR